MLGNGNPKYGDKGSNYKYQLSVLQLLDSINTAIPAAACCPIASKESTLLQVLAALQNGQNFDQALVVDTGGVGCPGNCPVYIQIRIFNTTTHVFDPPIYYDANGALVVPVGPLEFINPQDVLENILVQVSAINADLDVALSTRASQATLLAAKTVLDNIKLDTANLVSVNRTPAFTSDTSSVVIQNTPIGIVSYTLLFRGTGGQLNGINVPDNYTITFGNGKDPITVPITYLRPTGGTGQEVFISTLA